MASKEYLTGNELGELYKIYSELFVPALFARLTPQQHKEHLDRLFDLGYVEGNGLIVPTVIWSMLASANREDLIEETNHVGQL